MNRGPHIKRLAICLAASQDSNSDPLGCEPSVPTTTLRGLRTKVLRSFQPSVTPGHLRFEQTDEAPNQQRWHT
ncbi:hypothetical protein E2C01_039328 [Portunus trituberculatus]|uniref:Uncharacterized protein n=1 Tax=Portunus trituberculatus TaxID=210409 RepID=A0A5B7FGK0_PORTR|nr:hypothetical protein [Portunus trituberculatus]